MHNFIQNPYLLIGLAAIILLSIPILLLSYRLNRKVRGSIYECVDYFVRNCHDLDFYANCQDYITKFQPTFEKCKMQKTAWNFDLFGKALVNKFIVWYDETRTFITRVNSFMDEDHYFAHSELLSCLEGLDLEKNTKLFFTHSFHRYVNKNITEAFIDLDMYEREIQRDFAIIPQKHNQIFVKEELAKNKEYFDTVLKYPLDKQQRDSIVKLEDNCLVISSAGSGKTSTSVAKIKYLIEKRHITPSMILPLTYTTKAAKELTDRLGFADKGLKCYTFHSLAFHILAKTTQEKPDICEANTIIKCFYHLCDTNPQFKETVNTFLAKEKSLTMDEHDYLTSEAYYKDRALYGIQAPYRDMDNRIIFSRSEEEKKICTFLSENGVSFRYEQPYYKNTATEDKRQYRPDFTIYFNRDGRQYYIIYEHFGIDAKGNVPQWFGEGVKGGFDKANEDYNNGIKWKREINKKYGTQLIETTSAMFHDGTIYEKLTQQLNLFGITLHPLSEDEKFDRLVKRNKKMEDSIIKLITTFITLMKSNRQTIGSILDTIKEEQKNFPEFIYRSEFMLKEIFEPFYNEYEDYLKQRNQIDYTDLILKATDICESGMYKKEYDMILVDEFQDISIDRYRLLQSLRRKKNLTKLYCVGDDWQSIFRFSGSDLSLFNSFEDYFGFTEKCAIETTYRFGNPAIKTSSEFILANPAQVAKDIKPANESVKTEVTTVAYNGDEKNESHIMKLKSIISNIPKEESIMIIGRYHFDAEIFDSKIVERNQKQDVISVNLCGRKIPFNTIHSAKGLEADHVIILNCSQDGSGFPSRVSDDPILGYVLSKPEAFPFAEERRLFYVAITRAKKHTYVMYNTSCPSQFVTEIGLQSDSMICPQCKRGNLKLIKEGENQYSKWRLYVCSNSMAHCGYKLLLNYQFESEIIPQFEKIKNSYVLHIREDQVEQLKKENSNAKYVIIPSQPPIPQPIVTRDGKPFPPGFPYPMPFTTPHTDSKDTTDENELPF